MQFGFDLIAPKDPCLGLIVLQADERIELDFRRLMPHQARLFVSRIASAPAVTPGTLKSMAANIPKAAEVLPDAADYAVIGYGCTSASAQIGTGKVHELVRQGASTAAVTEPLSALIAVCAELGVTRLGILSPYVEAVSDRLRAALHEQQIETPVFGSFNEADEARVARITPQSIANAARQLATQGGVDAIFLSCTNLNTLDIIAPLGAETGLPVLSSNLVLAWHMCQLAGIAPTMAIGAAGV